MLGSKREHALMTTAVASETRQEAQHSAAQHGGENAWTVDIALSKDSVRGTETDGNRSVRVSDERNEGIPGARRYGLMGTKQ